MELIKVIQITEASASKIREKIIKVVSKDKAIQEEMRKSMLGRLEDIQLKKKSLLNKYVGDKIDDETYNEFKAELDGKESQYQSELNRVENTLLSIVQTIETAIGLTKNCQRTFKKASYDQKTLIAQILFEKIIIEDKKIVSGTLNHPFVFICKGKAAKSRFFQLQYNGGPGENRTRVSAMRMPCSTTRLQAQIVFYYRRICRKNATSCPVTNTQRNPSFKGFLCW